MSIGRRKKRIVGHEESLVVSMHCDRADDPGTFLQFFAIILTSGVAGVMNAIAGGGTLLTFPALIGLGISPSSPTRRAPSRSGPAR